MSDDPEETSNVHKPKDLSREEKALVGRRFELYFNSQRTTSEEYFRKGQKPY